MTKTLTEQWREGELPEDCYYILTKDGHIKKERTCFYSCKDGQCFSFTENRDIEEVLASVPSYEEYEELLRHSELSRNLVYEVLVNQKEYNELLDKAKEYKLLQERLSIATKALKDCYNDMKYWAVLTHRNQRILSVIKKALKEMEGVK